jgi:hypothetical protein
MFEGLGKGDPILVRETGMWRFPQILSSDRSPGRMEGGAGRERTRSETLIPLNVSAKVSILLADDPVDRRAALPSFSIKASRLSARFRRCGKEIVLWQ